MSGAPTMATGREERIRYSALLRITHWLNVPLLLLMIASGIQIWWAYPAFGPDLPKPETLYNFFAGSESEVDPRSIVIGGGYQGFVTELASRFGIGGWLAGALRWHFAVMWLFTLNGIAYLLLLLLTEEGRHYRLRRADLADLGEMLRHPMRTFFHPPGPGKFNPVQKLTYLATILAGALSILSGLALYKTVQLGFLTTMFGGYQASRMVHFGAMVYFVIFLAVHTAIVLAHGWRRGLGPMIVGVKANREEFRARQHTFARRLGRWAAEAALLLLALWAGGILATGMNLLLGGTAPALPFGVLLYAAARLGPIRIWLRRAREADRRRMEITA